MNAWNNANSMQQPDSQHPYTARILEILRENNDFYGQDILAVSQFNRANLGQIFKLADEIKKIVNERGGLHLLRRRVMAAVFYEPSTRTSSSFITSMERLGGSVIPITSGVQFSSVSKGETLADTMRVLEQFADVIVLRHPEVGAAQIAANATKCPVINAGDGIGEHPTQALLDLYTIMNEQGSLDGITVTMVGDLLYGRTVHSLAKVLCNYDDVKIRCVSPDRLKFPETFIEGIKETGVDIEESSNLDDFISESDVLYVTRVQQERFEDQAEYESLKDSFIINTDTLQKMKSKATIMHPLPRINEIAPEVDSDPRAAYFRQVRNGLFIRMALLAAVCD
jgi:aspartate carbamoyltransferase